MIGKIGEEDLARGSNEVKAKMVADGFAHTVTDACVAGFTGVILNKINEIIDYINSQSQGVNQSQPGTDLDVSGEKTDKTRDNDQGDVDVS